MNAFPFPELQALWKEAPRWRAVVVSAAVSTILAVVFWPSAGAGHGTTSGSYLPSSAGGAPVAPPVPTGVPAPPMPGSPPASNGNKGASASAGGQAPQVLNVVEPVVPKIKPGQTGAASIHVERPKDESFATETGSKTTAIKPRSGH